MGLEVLMQEIRLEDRDSDCEVGVCAADRCAKIKAFSCQAHARRQPRTRTEGCHTTGEPVEFDFGLGPSRSTLATRKGSAVLRLV